MRIDILSLFPAVFQPILGESIPGIAQEKGALELHTHDIRDYTDNKHGKVDDRPFGGGPGMVLCCQPVVDAVEAVVKMATPDGRLFFLTPGGRCFRQSVAAEFASEQRIILVCGRYEGFDRRIFEILQPEFLSVGDFVLSGGEPAAILVVDAVSRLLPGVLGSPESLAHESFNSNMLDYPQYTQPAEFRGIPVPEVLRSGDHARIRLWRENEATEETRKFRPDLLRNMVDFDN